MAMAIESNLIDGFTYYLNRLKHVVTLIEQYEKANPGEEGVLAARLHNGESQDPSHTAFSV